MYLILVPKFSPSDGQVAKKLNEEGVSATYAIANKNDFSHELDEFGLTASGDKPVVAAK